MGKTLFTRQGPIFGLLESQIEQEMLTIQATQEIKSENENEDEEFKIHSSDKLNEAFDKEFDESDDDDDNEFGVADSSYFRFSKGGNGSFKRTRNTEICR